MDDFNKIAPKKVFSEVGIILFFVTAIVQGIQGILVFALPMVIPNATQKPWFVWVITIVSLYLIAFPIYLKLMKRLPSAKIQGERKYSVGEIITLAFICLSATYIFNFVSLGINYIIGLLKGSPVFNPLETAVFGSNVLCTFIVACVIAPIVEEIMFRKVLLGKLAAYGEKTAIVISSLIFAFFHGNLSQILYAYALGYIFAYLTIKSGTIKYSVILHIIINTLGSVIIPYFVMSTNPTVAEITGFTVIVCILIGILLFILKRKVLFPVLNEQVVLEGQEQIKISTILLSKGMIVFWIASIILILFVTFVA